MLKMRLWKDKIEKSITSHFAYHYCGTNGHILHTYPIRKKSKKYVKQVWVPKKIIHVNAIKANTHKDPTWKEYRKKKLNVL